MFIKLIDIIIVLVYSYFVNQEKIRVVTCPYYGYAYKI